MNITFSFSTRTHHRLRSQLSIYFLHSLFLQEGDERSELSQLVDLGLVARRESEAGQLGLGGLGPRGRDGDEAVGGDGHAGEGGDLFGVGGADEAGEVLNGDGGVGLLDGGEVALADDIWN